MNEDGTFSNGSGCGNDTASEHKMVRKYMIDSVTYWAKEYHIDGFRFDLMGLHDVETVVLPVGDGATLSVKLPQKEQRSKRKPSI